MAKVSLAQTSRTDVRELRSVNIELDLGETSRLHGYVPTNKAVNLSSEIFSSLMGESNARAFAISAPYGSGKSSASLFWCQLLEQGKRSSALKVLFEEAKRKDRSTGKSESVFSQWDRRKPKGLAVPLVGFEGGSVSKSVMLGIQTALERNGFAAMAGRVRKLPRTIEGLRNAIEMVRADSGKCDALLIVWDEFGKVLEQIVAEGNGKALLEIQVLAEICSRTTSGTPAVFCILMHQSFARYSAALPSYVRNEWSKIEGRFKQINYIEDSKEIYELISQVVSRKFGKPEEKKSRFKKLAESCHQVGIFKEFDHEALVELLWAAAPLSPVSLYLLPRVSARVAQNERTMFSYLWSSEENGLSVTKKKWISPADLFDFFEDLMRIDLSVGGAHRLWIEAQTALKKAGSVNEQEVVKALACIKVGTTSGSLAGTSDVVDLAFGVTEDVDHESAQVTLRNLEQKKAIYFRRLNSEYSVWQGSDVDIRNSVEETKSKILEDLDLIKILSRDFAPPFRFPQRHNDLKCIRRYYDGRYIVPSEMNTQIASALSGDDSYLDGRIYYVVAETEEEVANAVRLAETIQDERVLFAIPRSPLQIREGLAEIEAYHQLLNDPDFRKQDPIVEQELKQLTDDSEQHLRSLVAKLVIPGSSGPIFFWRGGQFKDVESMGDLKRLLSTICDSNYPKTPIVNNELINKSEPSPQIVNARKSILRGLFAGYGAPQLGLSGYGPDVSIFRALFMNTKIYDEVDGSWALARSGKDLKDPGLRGVWQLGIDYWSKPSATAKDLRVLFGAWEAPPFGLRRGLFPLLLAASFRATGAQAQIFEDGSFVTDFKPETFERMARSPQAFSVVVPELDHDFSDFLDSVTVIFAKEGRPAMGGDKVRVAAQAVMNWLRDLPPVAREPGMISKNADELLSALLDARDPTKLFREAIRGLSAKISFSEVSNWLETMKLRFDGVESEIYAKTRRALGEAIQALPKQKINSAYSQWLKMLPGIENEAARKRYQTDRRASGFVNRIEQGYPSEELFVMSLAELFAEKPLKFWNSGSFAFFQVNLHQTIRWMEDLADDIDLADWNSERSTSKAAECGERWIERRMRNQFERVVQRLGKKEAQDFVTRVMESLGEK